MTEVKNLKRRHEGMLSERTQWEATWESVGRLVRPNARFFERSPATTGDQRSLRIYDSEAMNGLNELVSALDSTLTNTSIRWFELQPDGTDPEQMRDDERVFLHRAATAMMGYLDSPGSGFRTAAPEVYADLGAFGTGCMSESPTGPDGLPRYTARALATIWIRDDDDGAIIEVHRKTLLSPEEVRSTYPRADLPDGIKNRIGQSTGHVRDVEVVTAVWSRKALGEVYDPDREDADNRPWGSAAFLPGPGSILSSGGYWHNPFYTPRWRKAPEEPYGRSPCIDSLPAIRTSNVAAYLQLEAFELAIRPPIMVPANMVQGDFRYVPGGIIPLKAGTRDFPQPLQHGANPEMAEFMLNRARADIARALLVDRFRLPENDRMTATEIQARIRQNMFVVSPIVSRLLGEWMTPLLASLFASMLSKNMLGQVPETMSKRRVSVTYRSPMAASRESGVVDALGTAMTYIAPMAQIDPLVIRNIDTDKAARMILHAVGIPQALRPEKTVKQERRAAEEAAQQGNQLEHAGMMASAVKDAAAGFR